MILRTIMSFIVCLGYAAFGALYNPQATLLLGRIAGSQFEPNDAAYIQTSYTFSAVHGIGAVATLILLVLLACLWAAPLKKWVTIWMATLAAVGFALMVMSQDSYAYYDKTDYTEAYTILPNESAFWIPDAGNNKDNQAQLDSEDYLKANKLAVKRFIIPHAKLSGSGGFFDYYVPAGRLIIVDRTPYSREWVNAENRGTSAKKEGFVCQTKEGLNISTGVMIGASVTEVDSAKFLYNFGVTTGLGNRNDPIVIFASLYYGRSLTAVMDDVGRKTVGALVCNEIGSRTFEQANNDTVPIIQNVAELATAYFKSVGITVNFMGWGDTFEYDTDIQHAVNRLYIAKVEQVIAASLQPYATTIQALASADALRAFGDHSDGKWPTTVVGSVPDLNTMFGAFLAAPKVAPPAPAAK